MVDPTLQGCKNMNTIPSEVQAFADKYQDLLNGGRHDIQMEFTPNTKNESIHRFVITFYDKSDWIIPGGFVIFFRHRQKVWRYSDKSERLYGWQTIENTLLRHIVAHKFKN
jgi:hypothetical protein